MSAAYPSADPFGGVGDTPAGPPRWLAAVAGVLSVLIGLAALVWPGPTLLVVGILFGCYLAVWSAFALVRAIGAHEVPIGLRLLDVVVSALGLLVGIALIVRPGASVATVALLLGFWWLFLGVMQLVHGVIALAQKLEDPDPGRVAQGAEELGLRLVQRHTHGDAPLNCVLAQFHT